MDTTKDEINLQELAIRLIRYFRKNFRFVSISCLVGIVTGVVAWFGLPKVYESKMILMSDILTESYSERITESLDNLIKENNIAGLAQRLSIAESEASGISEIDIESVKKTKAATEPEETIFIVTANVRNREMLPRLQEGVINFLRNNEFVKIRVKQREFTCNAMIEKLGKEIRSLDSLKQRLLAGKTIYNGASEMLLIDPTTIYETIIDLTKQQINYQNMLELSNSIQLVEGFTAFEKPAEPKLSMLLVGGFLLGFFVAVGVLTFEQLFKLAKSSE